MKWFSESIGNVSGFGLPEPDEPRKRVEFCGEGIWESVGCRSGFPDDALVVLDERNTLYDYGLKDIDAFRRSIGTKTLGIICKKLYTPRGSGQRRWVNSQDGRSNFNANIFLELDRPALTPVQIFSLQQKISLAIVRTIEAYAKNDRVEIRYPFHYVMNGGKIAGHLLQSRKTATGSILRIGIGINSDFAPELPKNDDLAKCLYGAPVSLGLEPDDWLGLYLRLNSDIREHLAMDSCHEGYRERLSPKVGDAVRIFADDGSIRIGAPLAYARLEEVAEDGKLRLDDGRDYGAEYHVQKSR
jgi:biotin-(acetyl-CoA carboxylase) ligase